MKEDNRRGTKIRETTGEDERKERKTIKRKRRERERENRMKGKRREGMKNMTTEDGAKR